MRDEFALLRLQVILVIKKENEDSNCYLLDDLLRGRSITRSKGEISTSLIWVSEASKFHRGCLFSTGTLEISREKNIFFFLRKAVRKHHQ